MTRFLDRRSSVARMAVMLVLAIGVFVALNHGDDAAQASPSGQPAAAAPQGFSSGEDFQCVAFGITRILSSQAVPSSYKCDSEQSETVTCLSDELTRVACSPDASNIYTCTLVTGSFDEATCTSTGGGSHACSAGEYGVTCLDTGGGDGKDYIECYQTEGLSTLECGTDQGPVVCVIPVTDSVVLHIVCRTLYRSQQALWADADCDGEISSRDNQAILRNVLGGNPLSQTEPCPNVGDLTYYSPGGF